MVSLNSSSALVIGGVNYKVTWAIPESYQWGLKYQLQEEEGVEMEANQHHNHDQFQHHQHQSITHQCHNSNTDHSHDQCQHQPNQEATINNHRGKCRHRQQWSGVDIQEAAEGDGKMAKNKGVEAQLAVMANNIEHIRKDICEMKESFVTRIEFTPVRKIVYGIVGLVLTAVFGALVGLVIIK